MTLQGELDHKDQWKKLSQQELEGASAVPKDSEVLPGQGIKVDSF